jgi:hypothetical protein
LVISTRQSAISRVALHLSLGMTAMTPKPAADGSSSTFNAHSCPTSCAAVPKTLDPDNLARAIGTLPPRDSKEELAYVLSVKCHMDIRLAVLEESNPGSMILALNQTPINSTDGT